MNAVAVSAADRNLVAGLIVVSVLLGAAAVAFAYALAVRAEFRFVPDDVRAVFSSRVSRLGVLLLPLGALLLAVAAFGFTLFTALYGDQKGNFQTTPQFLIWVLLFTTQFFVWAAALVLLIGAHARTTALLPGSQTRLLGFFDFAALLFLLLFALFLLPAYGVWRDLAPFSEAFAKLPSCDEWALDHHCAKMTPTSVAGALVALTAVYGVLRIRHGFNRAFGGEPVTAAQIRLFVRLRENLQVFLATAGIVIGIATLVLGALRAASDVSNRPSLREQYCTQLKEAERLKEEAAEEYCAPPVEEKEHAQAFDSGYVLVFGLFYSALLMIAYAPTHLAMVNAGRRMRDSLITISGPLTAASVGDWHTNRTSFESALQLNVGATGKFKAAVAIFAPLFGSLVGLVLGTK